MDIYIGFLRSLRIFDSHGVLLNNARVTDLGFEVGQDVLRKADGVVAKIDKITPDFVHLISAQDGALVRASSESFVTGKWKKHVPKADPQLLEGWAAYSPGNSQEMLCSVIKGAVFKAMLEQYYEFKHEDAIQIFLKPSRDVKVCKGFQCHHLKLPCATSRLEIKSQGDKVAQGALQLGKLKVGTGKDLIMFMTPVVQMPKVDGAVAFVNPAWVMRTTTDRDEANMELSGSGRSGWSNQQLHNPSSKIALPIIRNFKALSEGDSLVLYRPDLAKSEVVEELQPLAKRRKS